MVYFWGFLIPHERIRQRGGVLLNNNSTITTRIRNIVYQSFKNCVNRYETINLSPNISTLSIIEVYLNRSFFLKYSGRIINNLNIFLFINISIKTNRHF